MPPSSLAVWPAQGSDSSLLVSVLPDPEQIKAGGGDLVERAGQVA